MIPLSGLGAGQWDDAHRESSEKGATADLPRKGALQPEYVSGSMLIARREWPRLRKADGPCAARSDEVSGSGRYGGPSDSADETGGGVRRGRASSGSPEGSSDSDGSDSDDGLPRGFEVACAGMRQKAVPGKPPAGEGGEDGPGGGRKRGREGEDGLGGKQGAGSGLATGQSSASGKKRKLGKKSVEDMSLAEQEALALKLIGA